MDKKEAKWNDREYWNAWDWFILNIKTFTLRMAKKYLERRKWLLYYGGDAPDVTRLNIASDVLAKYGLVGAKTLNTIAEQKGKLLKKRYHAMSEDNKVKANKALSDLFAYESFEPEAGMNNQAILEWIKANGWHTSPYENEVTINICHLEQACVTHPCPNCGQEMIKTWTPTKFVNKENHVWGCDNPECVHSAQPEESDSQIAKRKIEEYCKENDDKLFHSTKVAIRCILNWLDQGGE